MCFGCVSCRVCCPEWEAISPGSDVAGRAQTRPAGPTLRSPELGGGPIINNTGIPVVYETVCFEAGWPDVLGTGDRAVMGSRWPPRVGTPCTLGGFGFEDQHVPHDHNGARACPCTI